MERVCRIRLVWGAMALLVSSGSAAAELASSRSSTEITRDLNAYRLLRDKGKIVGVEGAARRLVHRSLASAIEKIEKMRLAQCGRCISLLEDELRDPEAFSRDPARVESRERCFAPGNLPRDSEHYCKAQGAGCAKIR